MIIFNSILLVILDFYIYKSLRATRMKFPKHPAFAWLWWGYSILLIGAIILSIYANIPLIVRSIILVTFFMTFTTKFIFALILLADDIRRGGVWLKRILFPVKTQKAILADKMAARDNLDPKEQLDETYEMGKPDLPENPVKGISRSEFLTKAGILVASTPLIPLSWGMISGAYDYRIRRQKLYLPELPRTFDGLRIAQISDVHSGSFYNKKAVLGGIEMLLAEKPDMVFVTGDMVNNLANEMREYQDIFAKIQAPLGVFSVLGNHDYGDYHFGREDSPAKVKNLQDLISSQRIMGWDLLMNEHRSIEVDNEKIAIVGVENWGTGRFPKHGRLQEALTGTEEFPVKLLLSHDPSHWRAEVLPQSNIDVTFSGHTHGMQFGVRTEHLKWSPVQYLYKEWAGLYRDGKQQLYVNTGFGFLGYPGRVGILPEITIFELVRGEDPKIKKA